MYLFRLISCFSVWFSVFIHSVHILAVFVKFCAHSVSIHEALCILCLFMKLCAYSVSVHPDHSVYSWISMLILLYSWSSLHILSMKTCAYVLSLFMRICAYSVSIHEALCIFCLYSWSSVHILSLLMKIGAYSWRKHKLAANTENMQKVEQTKY